MGIENNVLAAACWVLPGTHSWNSEAPDQRLGRTLPPQLAYCVL